MGEAGEGGEGCGEGREGRAGVQSLISGRPCREGAPGLPAGAATGSGRVRTPEGTDWRPEVQGSRQQGCCAPRQKRGLGKEGAGLPSELTVRGQQAEPAPGSSLWRPLHDPRVLATQALTFLLYGHGSGIATDPAGTGPGKRVLRSRNKACADRGLGGESGSQIRRGSGQPAAPTNRLTGLANPRRLTGKLNAEQTPASKKRNAF